MQIKIRHATLDALLQAKEKKEKQWERREMGRKYEFIVPYKCDVKSNKMRSKHRLLNNHYCPQIWLIKNENINKWNVHKNLKTEHSESIKGGEVNMRGEKDILIILHRLE